MDAREIRDRIQLHLDKVSLHRVILSNLLEHVDAGTDLTLVSKQLELSLKFISPESILEFNKGQQYVYVLALENECWYVGTSASVHDRIHAHFTGNGSQWTKTHRPLYVHSIVPGGKDLEKETTLQTMRERGWKSVRGHAWCAVYLARAPTAL
jgi:predicted GIY-YIG superfamily endonuclease